MSVRAGWLIDGTGAPPRRRVLLRIEKDRIESIDDALPFPGDVTDLSDSTLIPGLVDCHVHLFMSGTVDLTERKQQLCNTFSQARGHIERRLEHHRRHGVLAVRDGGDHGGYSLQYRKRFLSPGFPVRLQAPGHAWRAEGRYGSLIGSPPEPGLTLAESIVRSLRGDWDGSHPGDSGDGRAADHVKIVNSGLNSLLHFGKETPPQFTFEELREAVCAAQSFGLGTMVHANGKLPVQQAVEAGCRSVEHAFFMGQDNLRRMADRSVTWVPTVYTMQAYARCIEQGDRRADTAQRILEHQIEQISRARDLGVTLATGTDSGSLGVDHGASLRDEIRLFMEAGCSLEEALQCATRNGARLLGLERNLGTLEPGMPATFLAVRAAPHDLPGALDRLEAIYVGGRRLSL